jgi:hypothetical protein
MAATKQTAKGKRTTGKAKEIAGAVNRAKPGQKNQPPKRDTSKGRTTKEGNQPGEARERTSAITLEEIAEPTENEASQQGATESTADTENAGEQPTEQTQTAGAEQETETAQQVEQATATATEQASKGTEHKQTKIAKIERTGAAVTMQQGDEQKRGSINDLAHPKKAAMLHAIENAAGSITAAAEAAGVCRESHYNWVRDDPLYAELYEEYHRRSTQLLINEAIKRATEGQQEPIIYQGKQVIGPDGKPLYKSYKSDNLLMFLLKQRDPTFRDNYIHNVGIWGKSGQVNLVFNIPRPAGESINGIKGQGEVIDVEPEPVAQTKG